VSGRLVVILGLIVFVAFASLLSQRRTSIDSTAVATGFVTAVIVAHADGLMLIGDFLIGKRPDEGLYL